MQKPEPHEGFGKADGRRQAAHARCEDRRLEHPVWFVAQHGVDKRQLAQREHRFVPASCELTRQSEKAHQVTVIATELPREKDACHHAILA